jgi:hypothetical protein
VLTLITAGTGPFRAQWKHLVKTTVKTRETARWKLTTVMYSKLYIFKDTVLNIQTCVWWHVARTMPAVLRQCRLMVRFLVGEHGLNSSTGRYSGQGKLCVLCDGHNTETVEHFLFLCNSGSMLQTRTELWIKLESSMPQAMHCELLTMTVGDKTRFLLSGCYEWTPERMDTYLGILNYVHGLYTTRDRLLEQSGTGQAAL